MESILKRKVAIGATGLAVLAGAGGTYAAVHRSGTDERDAFLNDAAKRLNVSPKELTDALQGAFFDRLDAAVAAGRLTREQADEIKRRTKESGDIPFFGGPKPFFGGPKPFFGGPRPPFGPGFHGGPFSGAFGAAANYLGLTDDQLFRQLESGKSLAEVAKARNKSVDGLKTAIRDAVRAKLDAAVKDKKLTEAQEAQMLKDLDRRIDDIVKRGVGPRGPRGRDGHRWGGPRWGGPPGEPRWGGGPEGGPPPPP
jgi:hypothetical protein